MVGKMLGLLLVATAFAAVASAQITEPDNHQVIFRYRTFSGSRPSYVSPLTSAGGISFAAGSADIVTIARGTGFDDTIVTDFDGSTEFVQSSAAIDTTDSAGDDSFTVEAWFKADNTTGLRSIFSNTESYRGFALRINAGQLQGLVRFANGASYVSVTVDPDAGTPALSTGRWYYAVLHCRKQASYYELRLYLDGVKIGSLNTASLYSGVRQCTELPMVGAEPSGGTASGDYFDGQIYAVVVSNHDVYLNNYVKLPVVRDGGRYFGSPSYHDYLSTTASTDFRIHATVKLYPDVDPDGTSNKVVDRMEWPFANDYYIPQGLTYDATNGRFYVGYYWKDEAGTLHGAPSIIAEIDAATKTLRRTFQLQLSAVGVSPVVWHDGHIGGLAYHNGSLYTKEGTTIYRYRLQDAPAPNYIFDAATFTNPRGDQNPLPAYATYTPNISTNVDISCMDIAPDSDGTPIFWVADFDLSTYRKLLGYPIDANGNVAATPRYTFTLPVLKTQGVTCYAAGATTLDFYIATSYSTNLSEIYRVRYVKGVSAAQSSTKVFEGPFGLEDMTMAGPTPWTISESGARYYQKRTSPAPWDDLYPFLFGISP
jgi:hypothetical protein